LLIITIVGFILFLKKSSFKKKSPMVYSAVNDIEENDIEDTENIEEKDTKNTENIEEKDTEEKDREEVNIEMI